MQARQHACASFTQHVWIGCIARQTDCGRSQKARSHPPTHPSITNWWLFTRLSTRNYDSLIYSQNQTQTTPGCNCQKTPFHFAKVFGCFHIVIFRTKIWPHERFLLFRWKGIAKKKSFSMFHCNFALIQVSFPRLYFWTAPMTFFVLDCHFSTYKVDGGTLWRQCRKTVAEPEDGFASTSVSLTPETS